jgi:hypothetical protein
MDRMQLFDYLPMWVVCLLIVGFGLLAIELGFWLGKYWKKSHPDEEESHLGAIIAATLGLWGFLLALLVSTAISRFDARRELVVAEANTIGTTYLRAGYLPEPYSSQSRELLREYAGERLKLVELQTHVTSRQRSEEIQVLLWTFAQELAVTQPPNPVLALYIDSLNQTYDLHSLRVAALDFSHIPSTIYIGIFLVAM